MKARYEIEALDSQELTISIKMTVREWKDVRDQLAGFPGGSAAGQICGIIFHSLDRFKQSVNTRWDVYPTGARESEKAGG